MAGKLSFMIHWWILHTRLNYYYALNYRNIKKIKSLFLGSVSFVVCSKALSFLVRIIPLSH